MASLLDFIYVGYSLALIFMETFVWYVQTFPLEVILAIGIPILGYLITKLRKKKEMR